MRIQSHEISSVVTTDEIPRWDPMSIEEYAEFEEAMGAKIEKKGDVCWCQIRPYFYRPLFPFIELLPDATKGLFSRFSAVQHPVAPTQPHNSYMNVLVYEQPQSYEESNVRASFRRRIRKAARNTEVHPIKNVDILIEEGYHVYLSFYRRTGYSFRKDRADARVFADWARLLFRFPKVMVWGSYSESGLVGIWINCLVEDVLFLVSGLDSPEGIKIRSPELMLHTIRTNASRQSNIQRIYTGMWSSKQSLNDFKIERGARVLALPAHLHLHPVLLSAIGLVRKDAYERLKGMDEKQTEQVLKGSSNGRK